MLGDSKQASSATTSLIYITLGALTFVWSVVYFFYLRSHGGSDTAYLYVFGFIFTGIVLFLIGLAVGRIGYSARSAEVAPTPTQQVIAPTPIAAAPVATHEADPVAVAAAAPPQIAPVVAAAPVSTPAPETPRAAPSAPGNLGQLVPNA